MKENIIDLEKVRIFASQKMFEELKKDQTLQQIKNVASLPGLVDKAILLPDAHEGYGFPIGGVAGFDYSFGLISPGGIGFDINCGVRLLKTNVTYEQIKETLKNIANEINQTVPSGLGKRSKIKLSEKELKGVLDNGAKFLVHMNLGIPEDLDFCESNGTFPNANHKSVSEKAKRRGIDELGTLGSGNHFLEIQKVEKVYDEKIAEILGLRENLITIMIHTGSRGLGHQVATDYIREMLNQFKGSLPDKELVWASIHTELGKRYWEAMAASANYAWANRQLITYLVREILKNYGISADLVYDIAHNIAKIEEYNINGKMTKVIVHRKGATRAFGKNNPELPSKYRSIGQPVLIPGSMGSYSYVLIGKDSDISLGSSAHGAGRMLSRNQAIKTLDYGKVMEEMKEKGVIVIAPNKESVLEEAPEAYKNVDEVVDIIDSLDIAKKIVRLKPLYVIKG
ncbi:MAG: RtcB family protein [Candidatus Woesearchaeota archaeon]